MTYNPDVVDASPPPTILLLTRSGCHLCDDARGELAVVLADRAARGLAVPAVREVDIDSDQTLLRRHLETIPVLVADRDELPLAMRPGTIRAFLARVLDAPRSAGAEAGSATRARAPSDTTAIDA